MSTRRELPPITDDELGQFFAADLAVLVVTLTTCDACAVYEADVLDHWPGTGMGEVALAKLVLDGPGLSRFQQENPWLAELDFLPYTLLYVRGVAVEEFATSHATYLLDRLVSRRTGDRPWSGRAGADDGAS